MYHELSKCVFAIKEDCSALNCEVGKIVPVIFVVIDHIVAGIGLSNLQNTR